MRFILTLLAMTAVAVVSVSVTASPASAQSCEQLWVERNSYYKRNGYCFATDRARAYFGNRGCSISNMGAVPLSSGERRRIAQIVAMEREFGCN